MRLILSLKPIKFEKYSFTYNHKIMSFIYNVLKNSYFNYLHDNRQIDYHDKPTIPFCFSNIFSKYGYSDKKHIKYLIISSPDDQLIILLFDKIKKLYNPIYFGDLEFELSEIKII